MKTISTLLVAVILLAGAALVSRYVAENALTPPSLTVKADPPGSAVYVDGLFRGLAPVTVEGLSVGKHPVRVEAEGFEVARKNVDLSVEHEVVLSLPKAGKASLKIDSVPAGATVVLDGQVRGKTPLALAELEPGRHFLEIANTNYLPEHGSVDLESGKEGAFSVELKHRQVEAYKKRLEKDPGDIGAYNDLGELLFVLGEFEEAAKAYTDGFFATGQYGSRDEPNQRNMTKLASYPRQKRDSKGRFQELLDDAIMTAVGDGKMSPMLFKEFRKVRYSRYPERYMTAFMGLLDANPDNSVYVLNLMEFARQISRFDIMASAAEKLVARKEKKTGEITQAARLMIDTCRSTTRDKHEALLPVIGKTLDAAVKMNPRGEELGAVRYEQSRFADCMGQKDKRMELLREASSVASGNGRFANRWRMELADIYADSRQYQNALDLCELIDKTKDKKDPTHQTAKKLSREMKDKLEKIRKEQEVAKQKEEARKKEEARLREEEKKRQEEIIRKSVGDAEKTNDVEVKKDVTLPEKPKN